MPFTNNTKTTYVSRKYEKKINVFYFEHLKGILLFVVNEIRDDKNTWYVDFINYKNKKIETLEIIKDKQDKHITFL